MYTGLSNSMRPSLPTFGVKKGRDLPEEESSTTKDARGRTWTSSTVVFPEGKIQRHYRSREEDKFDGSANWTYRRPKTKGKPEEKK